MRNALLRLCATTAIVVLTAWTSTANPRPHGANYVPGGGTNPGPGDTVPAPPPGAGPSGPSFGPVPSGPTTPGAGPSTPGGPLQPSSPTTPGGNPGSPGGAPGGGPSTPSLGEVDTASWELWWHYNRHRWLDVRAEYRSSEVTTGSDEFYLGRGASGAADRLAPSPQRLSEDLIPLLVATLRSDSSPDLSSAAVVALAKCRRVALLRGVDLSAEIVPLLRHANIEVSETAAVALGMLGGSENVDVLRALLDDDVQRLREKFGLSLGTRVPERVRAFAAYGLAASAPELSGYEQLVLANALRATIQTEWRRRGPDEVIAACVLGLGLLRLPDGADKPQFHASSASSIVHRGHQIEFLLDTLQSPKASQRVRAVAAAGLGRVGGQLPKGSAGRSWLAARWVEWLTDRSTDALVRRAAVAASPAFVGGTLDEDRALYTALNTVSETCTDSSTRARALIALGEASGAGRVDLERDQATIDLVDALGRGSSALRPWAALGLGIQQRLRARRGERTSEDAHMLLRTALSEARSAYSTGAMAIALGLGGHEGDGDLLFATLEKASDPGARGYLCLGLGLVGARGHNESIARLAHESRAQPALLANAALSLGLLGDRREVATLIDLFANSHSATTQAGLASALGLLGDARALEPLLELVRDSGRSLLARAFAVVALGGLADDRDRPWNEPLLIGTDYLGGLSTLASPLDGRGVLDLL